MSLTRKFAVFILCLSIATAAAIAYTSGARSSLLRSRDQVADQRAQLLSAYNEIDKSIAQLQDKKFAINRYLTDCDRNLREIDRMLEVQDDAYRGR